MKENSGNRNTERMPHEYGGLSDVSKSQRMPKTPATHHKLGRASRISSWASEEHDPCQHLDFRLLASRNVRNFC